MPWYVRWLAVMGLVAVLVFATVAITKALGWDRRIFDFLIGWVAANFNVRLER